MATDRSRLQRIFGVLRRSRDAAPADDELRVDPGLDGEGDLDAVRRIVDDVVAGRGGEVAARRRAAILADSYLSLDGDGRLAFFGLLADDYDVDAVAVREALSALEESDEADPREARRRLRASLLAPREHLLRRFVGIEAGLSFLVRLRRLLDTWFDVGFLTLRHITWATPASILEQLIAYEAVHEIRSWDDLRNRLGPDRRCYAFQHPALADELLIFVQVAFTRGLADDVTRLLDPTVEALDPADADTAIFYSISNCQPGLAGVRLGDFLIKRVAREISAELGHLSTFATLSPMPGFRDWLAATVAGGRLGEVAFGSTTVTGEQLERDVGEVLDDLGWYRNRGLTERVEPVLSSLAARYLTTLRERGDRAVDPVAHFHLSNGARVERIQFLANATEVGMTRSVGMMVNYQYDLDAIEENVDGYVGDGSIAVSSDVQALLG